MAIPIEIIDLGTIEYSEAWKKQEYYFQKNVAIKLAQRKGEMNNEKYEGESTKNYILFCEHPHVYTLGKSGDIAHLLLTEERLKEINATFFPINRGGDITYHGYGQLVVYPILDLETYWYTDIHLFLRNLEETIINLLKNYGLKSEPNKGLTGVWIDTEKPGFERKICAMGIRCSRWITMHGLALNVNTNMDYFNYIVPCGISDKKVTSMKQELEKEIDMSDVKKQFLKEFALKFEAEIV